MSARPRSQQPPDPESEGTGVTSRNALAAPTEAEDGVMRPRVPIHVMTEVRPDFTPAELPPLPRGQVERVAKILDELLNDRRTPQAVAAFYDSSEGFAGDTFLALEPNERNTVTTADLLAVTLLDVAFKPAAVRALLAGGELAERAERMFAQIPLQVPLWKSSDKQLAAAGALWRLLTKSRLGVGPTKAGKLLARKRPDLIPVVDSVVVSHLGCAEDTYWTTLREIMRKRDRRNRILQLRPGTPLIRILDTVMWMHWSRSRRATDVMRRLARDRSP
ncbi:DUF6308 family protein [Micromonospora sp. NPDC007208]|uniref:DUF6308 family protein n=1 Tax=Micromonospora sp. NPDC007208 TaxID=3364236 RepID=UPI0036CBB736